MWTKIAETLLWHASN